MTLFDRPGAAIAVCLLTTCFTARNSPRAAGRRSAGQHAGRPARLPERRQATRLRRSEKKAKPGQPPRPTSCRRLDDEGRTRLPMDERERQLPRDAHNLRRARSCSGWVPGNPDLYYIGAADGGVFRTNDGGITWKALFQHESVMAIGAARGRSADVVGGNR